MSGGNQSEKTTTQSNLNSVSAPWGPAAGKLEGILNDAGNLYNSGVGQKVYQGSTVIPWAGQTESAMGDIERFAGESAGAMGKPMQAYSGMMDVLNPIAKGDFSKDTTFMSNLGAAQEAARTAVGLQMGNMGRFGSAGHTKALARETIDRTNQAMLERQNWASGELGKYGAAMPSAFSAALMPADSKMQIGGMYEDLANRNKIDEIRKFDAGQNAPWDNLSRYAAILGGAGQLGGTRTGTESGMTLAPSSRPSFGQQALGFGTALAGSAMRGGK
jgi:hypothetical protein